MDSNPAILFCKNPVDPSTVDPDFAAEMNAATQAGFSTVLLDYESLTTTDDPDRALRRVKQAAQRTRLIYRGWMLTPQEYTRLFVALGAKGYDLVNSPTEYQNCHYLPDSLKYIKTRTPRAVFAPINDQSDIESLVQMAHVFGNSPVVIKDYVKSEKHDWEQACYVANAFDSVSLERSIGNLLKLRDKYLNVGVVVREFVELNLLTNHSKSGMPLAEEYRLFFFNNELLSAAAYWEEGTYATTPVDTKEFEAVARTVESNFFCMDIARKKNGELIIIELGDGQVAGLPERMECLEFYRTLWARYKVSS